MSPGAFRPSAGLHATAILFLALLAPACGGGGKGKAAIPPGVLTVTLRTPAGVQKGIVPIGYTLIDPTGTTCTIAVEYSINGGVAYQPATAATGGDGTAALVSSPGGVPHTFTWNSLADGVATGAADSNVRLRITPTAAAPGSASATSNFTVDNVGNTAPSATITPLAGTQSGLVPVSYALSDTQSDPCAVQAFFSTNGGATFAPATAGPGGDGASNLASTPGGTAHSFLWNSVADGVAPSGMNSTVRFRLQPGDGTLGGAATTADFSVDNSGKSSGSTVGGAYPLQFNGSSVSDWATSAATDGVNLYVFGFEEFDFESTSGSNCSWRLRKRLIQTGAAVAGFGTAGTLSVNPGSGLDVPFKVVVSGGSLYLLYARESNAGTRNFSLRIEKRSAATGALVNSFGSNGVVTTSSPATFDGIPLPWTMAVDGSFVYLAGPQEVSSTDSQWRIEKRDRTTGELVLTFGLAGRVDENPSGTADGCFSIVLGTTSMWVVGAEEVDGTSASNGRIRIERRKLLDGSLETGFGAGGIVTVDPGLGDDLGEDAITDGTSLFVFSRVETASGSGLFQGRIEKRDLATGALVTVVTGSANDPTGELPFSHLALSGANLYVCQAGGSADATWTIEKRSTSDLSLIPSFGTAGVVQSNPSVSGYDRPLGIVATGGVILVAGMDSTASDEQWRIEARWK
jgi:hypothetical protein